MKGGMEGKGGKGGGRREGKKRDQPLPAKPVAHDGGRQAEPDVEPAKPVLRAALHERLPSWSRVGEHPQDGLRQDDGEDT